MRRDAFTKPGIVPEKLPWRGAVDWPNPPSDVEDICYGDGVLYMKLTNGAAAAISIGPYYDRPSRHALQQCYRYAKGFFASEFFHHQITETPSGHQTSRPWTCSAR